jgi:hypothetical protein
VCVSSLDAFEFSVQILKYIQRLYFFKRKKKYAFVSVKRPEHEARVRACPAEVVCFYELTDTPARAQIILGYALKSTLTRASSR